MRKLIYHFIISLSISFFVCTNVNSTPTTSVTKSKIGAPVDFSGVWETIDIKLVSWPTDPEMKSKLTDIVIARIADLENNFDVLLDDSGKHCYYRGMPWVMLNKARNYATEIYQTRDRVIAFVELFDTYRNIRLDVAEVPAAFTPSGNGFSYAHWEGEVLVIETKGFTETYDVSPTHRSKDAYMVERWSLRQDDEYGEVLDIDFTIEDSFVYKTPAKARTTLKRSPKGTVVGGYNCSEYIWENHIDKRRKEIKSEKIEESQ